MFVETYSLQKRLSLYIMTGKRTLITGLKDIQHMTETDVSYGVDKVMKT